MDLSDLQLLLQLIVDHLADFVSEPAVFDMFSEQLKKAYFNILIKHDRLGRSVHTQSWGMDRTLSASLT